MVLSAYNIILSAEAFADGLQMTADDRVCLPPPSFHICGRSKDLIIRGGENIMPEEVVNALMACSGVADARVFDEPDEFWGETVLAAVVPADGFVLDERRLSAELEGRLAKFKRPSRSKFLESFPRLASGKVDMVALKRLCLH